MYFNYFQITAESGIKLGFLLVTTKRYSNGCITRALQPSWINPSHCLASDYDLKSGIIDIILETTDQDDITPRQKPYKDDVVDASSLP
jgi:hypothetical protein